MLERVEEWQLEMEGRIRDISGNQTKSRAEAEERFTTDLKSRLSQLQHEMTAQYERLDGQVSEFESRLVARMEGAEGNLDGLETRIKSDMADLRRASAVSMESELTELSGKIGEELRERQLEVESSLRVLGEQVEERENKIDRMLESAEADVVEWQERVLTELQEAKTTVEEGLENLADSVQTGREDLLASVEKKIYSPAWKRKAIGCSANWPKRATSCLGPRNS
jgi:hypothetical protein